MAGKRSLLFARPPVILGAGCVAGEKEGKGAFGKYYDLVEEDPLFGGKTWEEAESKMQQLATQIALRKGCQRTGRDPVSGGRRSAGAADRYILWHYEF